MSDEERSQPASPQARERALEQGRAPATPEVAGVLVALCVAALSRHVPQALHSAFTRLAAPLWSPQTFTDLARGTLDLGALAPPDLVPPGVAILAMVPVAIALALMLQKGFRFSPERVAPDPGRLEPRAPWGDALDALELCVRAAARLALGFYLGYRLFVAPTAPLVQGGATFTAIASAFTQVAFLWTAVAALDWLWRKYRFEQSIMMTSAEVRAENRSSEGDPRVKGEIRARLEAGLKRGPSRRVLLREGDVVALVTLYEDAARTPAVQLGARGVQAARLLAGSARLDVPVLTMYGVRALAGARPGSAIPEALFAELGTLHARLFPRKGDAK